METADSNKELSARKSSLVVLIALKIEIVLAVLFFSEGSIDKAISLGIACALVNQVTEMYYLEKTTLRQKLIVLLKSLLVTLFFYLAAYSIGVDFMYYRHGQTGIETYKIWLLAKVLIFLFVFLGACRLLAIGGDWLINRHEQNKNQKGTII
jgi:hypothetical protein